MLARFIQMPAALSYPMNMARYDWGYKSEPELILGDWELACPRARSLADHPPSMHGLCCSGHAKDCLIIGQSGAKAWAYADITAYYKRMGALH